MCVIWFFLFLLCFCFLFFWFSCFKQKLTESHQGPHEKRLLRILDDYNTLERPVSNESEALNVTFGLTLQQIIDVVIKFYSMLLLLLFLLLIFFLHSNIRFQLKLNFHIKGQKKTINRFIRLRFMERIFSIKSPTFFLPFSFILFSGRKKSDSNYKRVAEFGKWKNVALK